MQPKDIHLVFFEMKVLLQWILSSFFFSKCYYFFIFEGYFTEQFWVLLLLM